LLLRHSHDPLGVFGIPPSQDVFVKRAQLCGDRPHHAGAYGTEVHASDGDHLRSGACHEQLLGDIQLGTVDGTFDHCQSQFLLRELDDRAAGDALEDVVRCRRGDHDTVADDEHVHRAALRDVAVLVQHKSLVEAGARRLGLGQRGVGVRTTDLAPGGDDVIVHPPPGGDGGVRAGVVLDILRGRQGKDGDGVGQIVQAHADAQVGFVDEGADVDVAHPAFGFKQLEGDLRQAIGRVLGFHAHHFGGVQQPAEVVLRAEDVHFLLVVVPVAAQSPKNCRPVIKGMSSHADLRVLERDDLTHKIGVLWEIHEHLRVVDDSFANIIHDRVSDYFGKGDYWHRRQR
jgi:hypothetical protein